MMGLANIGSKNIQQARPLLYVGGLVGAWVIARIMITLAAAPAHDTDLIWLKPIQVDEMSISNSSLSSAPNGTVRTTKVAIHADDKDINSKLAAFIGYAKNSKASESISGGGALPENFYTFLFFDALKERGSTLMRPKTNVFNSKWDLPVGANGSAVNYGTLRDNNDAGGDTKPAGLASRLSAYAYIFARSSDGNADALGARYGGSQAAIQAAYRINPNQDSIWDVTARAQSALNSNDREIAVGVRYKPSAKTPVALVAERRVRLSNADGYAFYAAGGKSAITLPANFKLDVYGQAGFSSAGDDTLFFDGSANVRRPVHSSDDVTVSIGGGAWAGGQRGAQRLDIGPSVSVSLSSGKKNYRISGDWRERVGGNATPSSSAAITLSTDF